MLTDPDSAGVAGRRGYVGRFAPSPTGPLHVGSIIAALASFLDARHHGGRWLVRMEDVDETRCDSRWAGTILRQLEALGLVWDGEVMVQSQRKPAYEAALERLRATGQVYACRCSRREIADSAVQGIEGPVYPGTCRTLGLSGEGLALRMRTDEAPVSFIDGIQGPCTQHLALEIGDFILKRRDGLFAYQLAVVVDDHDQGITHIVRGADLLASTPRQRHLQQQLGYATCEYSHVPIAVNAAGQKLSKQTLAPAIDATEGVALLNVCLTFLGQKRVAADNPAELLDQATAAWDTHRIPRVGALPAPLQATNGAGT
ncbi:MAG: tRNA glutamyl-Q(34) synthetase GluQRS [Burkholderiales bacterium]|nr:tRNA glutamyl-Q(34) synthetase GluQRS [Burkholderiales bacterium]